MHCTGCGDCMCDRYITVHWQMHCTGCGDCMCDRYITVHWQMHCTGCGDCMCDRYITVHWQMHCTGCGDCMCDRYITVHWQMHSTEWEDYTQILLFFKNYSTTWGLEDLSLLPGGCCYPKSLPWLKSLLHSTYHFNVALVFWLVSVTCDSLSRGDLYQ